MNTSKMLRLIIKDAANGQPWPLMGLIDFLNYDKGYSLKRLMDFARRRLGVSYSVAIRTLQDIYG